MDYSKLLDIQDDNIKLGVVGASQGFGYTTLVQVKSINQIDLRAISSINVEESYEALIEIGFDKDKIVVCKNVKEINDADDDDIIIVSDYKLIFRLSN